MRAALNPVWVERQGDADPPPGRLLAEVEREAAHLTRRDGKRRVILCWTLEPPDIELVEYSEVIGSGELTSIDID